MEMGVWVWRGGWERGWGVEGIQRIRVFREGVKAQGVCLTPRPSTEY